MGNITAASEWVSEADLERREEEWVDAVLLGALERIEFGWEQGSLYGDGGGFGLAVSDEDALTFCLVGAINASAAALRLDSFVRARAKRRLARALGEDPRSDAAIVNVPARNRARTAAAPNTAGSAMGSRAPKTPRRDCSSSHSSTSRQKIPQSATE